ncbi:MAG: LysE family translocator [Myxococcota bacterium]|nr:LysE family translocator [Myxococcota bacterium]
MMSTPTMYALMGCTFGLAGGLSPGPLTALLIRQTLDRGLRAGVLVAIAPLITDGPLLFIFCAGLGAVVYGSAVETALSLVGSVFLIYLAIETWRSAGRGLDRPGETPGGTVWRAILTNVLNPHPYLFWGAVGAPTTMKAVEDGVSSMVAFLLSFFVCLVGSKVVIASLIARHRDALRARIYRPMMCGLAIALGVFALVLVVDVIRTPSGG